MLRVFVGRIHERQCMRHPRKEGFNVAVEYLSVSISGDVVVVAFDICSSSDILEELTLRGDLLRFQRFLTSLKRYLMKGQKKILFDVYKFTGDGWILLFPADTDGSALPTFLRNLCSFFKKEFRREVLKYLDTPPKITGLTFGVEKGLLGAMKMYSRREYIGRAINIACRLQSVVGAKGGSPAYKALVSNAVFSDYFSPASNYKVFRARRTLRNIRGGAEFRCRKIELLN